MSGDVHVRFCESLGLQRPGPLTYKHSHSKRAACEKQARKRYAARKAAHKATKTAKRR
jgi:hypothetical protein